MLISCVMLKRPRQRASGSIVVSWESFSGVLMAMLFEVMNRCGAGLPGLSLCYLHSALWFHEAPSFQSSRQQFGSSFTPLCSTFPMTAQRSLGTSGWRWREKAMGVDLTHETQLFWAVPGEFRVPTADRTPVSCFSLWTVDSFQIFLYSCGYPFLGSCCLIPGWGCGWKEINTSSLGAT